MAFALEHRKHVDRDLTKIVRRELRDMVRAFGSPAKTPSEDVIHECRKSVKKVRAAAALLEETGATLPARDRKRLKRAGRALSRLRDSAVIIETLDRVRSRYPRQLAEADYQALHQALVHLRDRQYDRAERDGVAADTRRQLAKARKSMKDWKLPSIAISDIVDVVRHAYRRSRRAMRRAHETGQSASLHRWRKELKILWYQLRLARPLATGVAPLVADLKRLETALGDDHNLVVLVATLRGCRDLRSMRAELRQVERLSLRMRQQLRRQAFRLGRRLQARTPRAFARWLHASVEA